MSTFPCIPLITIVKKKKIIQRHLQPCQTSKMEYFAKIVDGIKLLTFFVKHSILDIWQGSDYASVISYSLFGKTEDVNKNDSVTM